MVEHRTSPINAAAVFLIILIVAVLVSGCAGTSTVTLTPTAEHSPSLGRVPLTMGIYHSPEFRGYKYVAAAQSIVFPLGPASVILYEEVYPKVFENVILVETHPPSETKRARLSAVIEPRIVDFHFLSTGPTGHNWAEIIYGFNLTSADGGLLASWTVTGTGEGGPTLGRAVDLAMQDAATKFMASFEHIPEARRWLLGLPAESATASGADQVLRSGPGLGEGIGLYGGVVAVRANGNFEPGGQAAAVDPDLNTPRLLAIQVLVENQGSDRLLLRRTDIALVSRDGSEISPLPASAFATVATARSLRIGPVAPGVGLAALPLLFLSLHNALAIEAEKKEMAVREEDYVSKELHDSILRKDQSVQGYVYFVAPPGSPDLTDLTLTVPVVDIDTATRYIVRLPVAGARVQGGSGE